MVCISRGVPGVSIPFLVRGWFCEVGSCGKKEVVRELIKKITNVQEQAQHKEKGLLGILVVLLN